MRSQSLRLGVNIDHVATIRNARGGRHPDPVRAAGSRSRPAPTASPPICARIAAISPTTTSRACQLSDRLPLNLEMAATDGDAGDRAGHRPHAACLVPEKREERTTEGGLDVGGAAQQLRALRRAAQARPASASRCSSSRSRAARSGARVGAPVVELHTGAYCEAGRAPARAARAAATLQRRRGRWPQSSASNATPATG